MPKKTRILDDLQNIVEGEAAPHSFCWLRSSHCAFFSPHCVQPFKHRLPKKPPDKYQIISLGTIMKREELCILHKRFCSVWFFFSFCFLAIMPYRKGSRHSNICDFSFFFVGILWKDLAFKMHYYALVMSQGALKPLPRWQQHPQPDVPPSASLLLSFLLFVLSPSKHIKLETSQSSLQQVDQTLS